MSEPRNDRMLGLVLQFVTARRRHARPKRVPCFLALAPVTMDPSPLDFFLPLAACLSSRRRKCQTHPAENNHGQQRRQS